MHTMSLTLARWDARQGGPACALVANCVSHTIIGGEDKSSRTKLSVLALIVLLYNGKRVQDMLGIYARHPEEVKKRCIHVSSE
jgi:hypothetical protein